MADIRSIFRCFSVLIPLFENVLKRALMFNKIQNQSEQIGKESGHR